jgi:hypothetical protein
MAGRTDWVIHLDEDNIAELEAALAHVKERGIGILELTREHFVIPNFARIIQGVRHDLEDGRGFTLIRGLPVERYSKSDAALIYWGIGTHLGAAFAQNAQGDMLGHVRDLGAHWKTDMKARGYQTRSRLDFHSDRTDVVGLLCLSKAKVGGLSRIVSSAAIHNEFLARRPDLWAVMSEPFCVDYRNEESAGQKPYYATPCFNMLNGRLFVAFSPTYIESAQRFPDVPRLTVAQREALALMSALCNDPAFYLDMSFEPGDMQFLCNYVILHSRTEYEDWEESERKRHLLRLWLCTPGFTDRPAAFASRLAHMIAWQRTPRKPVFDISEIDAELAH